MLLLKLLPYPLYLLSNAHGVGDPSAPLTVGVDGDRAPECELHVVDHLAVVHLHREAPLQPAHEGLERLDRKWPQGDGPDQSGRYAPTASILHGLHGDPCRGAI